MADRRRLKTIASRYDLDVLRHRDPLRLMRFRLSALFLFGTILACVPWLLGDHRAFESRCVSNAHKSFEQNCSQCHDQRGAPLWRMITLNNSCTSTSDTKCLKCHRKSNTDHFLPNTKDEEVAWENRHAIPKEELETLIIPLKCAGCHEEHRGHTKLAQVSDVQCSHCHLQFDHLLKSHEPNGQHRFELKFSDFSRHAQLGIWRKPEALNRDRADSPVSWPSDGKIDHPVDASKIRFNHHRHLDPNLPAGNGKTTSLDCTDCHQAELNGAYFHPINYQQHCYRCHKLGFPSTGELPHADPEIVQGVVLDRLVKNLKNNGDRPAQTDEIGGPTKPPIIPPSHELEPDLQPIDAAFQGEVRAKFQKVKTQLFESTPLVNGVASDPAKSPFEKNCTKCHFTNQDIKGSVGWSVVPTKIPSQWMAHSHFRHDRHFSVDCQTCHTRTGGLNEPSKREEFYPVLKEKQKSSTSIYASISAQDVLMPRIELCRHCHGHGASNSGRGSVSDKCVDCHDYHHTHAKADFRPGINEILNNGQVSAAELKKTLSIKGSR